MSENGKFATINLGTLNNSCFVIMPFAGAFNTVYERVIRPAVESAGMVCVRADEVFSKPQITHDIWKQIRSCRVVVAELTGRNPNVLYELGLAHAIGKPVIIITRNEADVPFDLKALRYLFYDVDDPFWGDTLKESLADMCSKVISSSDFGTVLEGIDLPNDVEFENLTTAPHSNIALFNLTGLWRGAAVSRSDAEDEDIWRIQLVQSGENLSGELFSTFDYEDELTVVKENLVGEINGNVVRLHGTAYSFLDRGKADVYYLDVFEGVVSDDGTVIEGTVTDEDHNEPWATISLARQE